MTTVRLSQSNPGTIASTIETGHNFTASALAGHRETNFGVPHIPNRYILKSYDEVIAVINTDDCTAIFSTRKWSSTTTKHQRTIGEILTTLGTEVTETSKRLDPYGKEF